jgi:PST family polysaccharide transporter
MSSASYRTALKATSITGVSQVVVLLLRLIKVKVIAVLLGPAGVGLFGILTTVVGLISTVVGMGMSGSAVRQVAEASASGDETRVARVVWTLRRTVLVLGLVGALLLILLATPVSLLSLGTEEYATTFIVLALAVLLDAFHGGQTALLRGLRKIPELAKLSMWGAFWGTVLSVPLVLLWGLPGIAPAMVVAAALSLFASWWHARRIQLPAVVMTGAAIGGELKGLLGLGLVFLATGVLGAVLQYGLRAILAHDADLVVVGEFQAAASLSMVYVTFILQAMAQDFYPRLTGIARDDVAANKLVNEQAELSLLLAGPGILATVALSPWLIELLYSDQFVAAVDVLRWQCFGVLLRLASWPIGYVLLARGEGRLFLATEVAANAFHIGVFWLLVQVGGLAGAGFALAAAYLFYLPLIYAVVRRVSGFRWSPDAKRVLAIMAGTYAAAMLVVSLLPGSWGIAGAGALAVTAGVYAYRKLARMTALPIARRVVQKVGRLLPRYASSRTRDD